VKEEGRRKRADLEAGRPRSRSRWGGRVGGSGKRWSVCCGCGWLSDVGSLLLDDGAPLISAASAWSAASESQPAAAGTRPTRGGLAAGAGPAPSPQGWDCEAQTRPRWVCRPASWVARCITGVLYTSSPPFAPTPIRLPGGLNQTPRRPPAVCLTAAAAAALNPDPRPQDQRRGAALCPPLPAPHPPPTRVRDPPAAATPRRRVAVSLRDRHPHRASVSVAQWERRRESAAAAVGD